MVVQRVAVLLTDPSRYTVQGTRLSGIWHGGHKPRQNKLLTGGNTLAYTPPCHLLLTRTKTMDKQDIKDLFDSHLDMTLRELSRITGRTVRELQRILMEEE